MGASANEVDMHAEEVFVVENYDAGQIYKSRNYHLKTRVRKNVVVYKVKLEWEALPITDEVYDDVYTEQERARIRMGIE